MNLMRPPKIIWRVYNCFGISWDPSSAGVLTNCIDAAKWDIHFPNSAPHRVVKYVIDNGCNQRRNVREL